MIGSGHLNKAGDPVQSNERAGLFVSLPSEATEWIAEELRTTGFIGNLSLRVSLQGDTEEVISLGAAVLASAVAQSSPEDLVSLTKITPNLLLVAIGQNSLGELHTAGQNLRNASEEVNIGHLTIPENPLPSTSPPLIPYGLTPRQMQILRCMAESMEFKEIAKKLYLTLNTVKTHRTAMYKRLGVNSRYAAIAKAREEGFLT